MLSNEKICWYLVIMSLRTLKKSHIVKIWSWTQYHKMMRSKVGIGRFVKKHSWALEAYFDKQKSFALVAFLHCIGTPLQLAQFKYSKLNLSRHPEKILSYYNTRPISIETNLVPNLSLLLMIKATLKGTYLAIQNPWGHSLGIFFCCHIIKIYHKCCFWIVIGFIFKLF